MRSKFTSILIIFLLVFVSFILLSTFVEHCRAETTRYVGGAGPGNFSSIQNAINASSNGDTVYVHNGTYYENVIVNKSINLIGEYKTTTIIDGIGNVGIQIGVNDTSIRDLAVTNCSTGIYVYNASFTIQNATLQNNTVYDDSYGVKFEYVANSTIISCDMHNNSEDGIWLKYASYNNILSNKIHDNSGEGMLFSSYVHNNTLIANQIYKNWNGIYVSEEHSDYNVIRSNHFYFNYNMGIGFKYGIYNVLELNYVHDNNYLGIEIYYDTHKTTITENYVYNNWDVGILLDNADDCTITANYIYNNSNGGVYIDLSDYQNCTVTFNHIYNNTGTGIFLIGKGDPTTKIASNHVYNNTEHGIWLYEAENASILLNTVYDNAQYGLYLYFASINNNITSNYIYNNTQRGIYIEGKKWYSYYYRTNDNMITSNYIYDNAEGIVIGSYADNNLIYNNYLINTKNAEDIQGNNIWNITKTPETNIVGGAYLGGNYWGDYTGFDTNHDGFGDINYTIEHNNDTYPLVISPEVSTVSPTDGSTDISRSTNIVVNFDKSMNQTTAEDNFSISPSISGSYTWSNSNKTLTFNPSSNLGYNVQYTVTISWNAPDTSGNVMIDNHSWSFTTERRSNNGGSPPSGDMPRGEEDNETNLINPPTADPNGPYNALTYQPITFDGSDSTDNGTITNYTWNFGDGSVGFNVNPTHTYTTSDVFIVTLTVTDNTGLTDTNTTTANITLDTDDDGWSDQDEEYYGSNKKNADNVPITIVIIVAIIVIFAILYLMGYIRIEKE